MLLGLVQIAVWIAAGALAVIAIMLALNSMSALKWIGHRVEILPQAMLVRYGGMALLAACAAWLGLPALLTSTLLVFAVIGFGDAFIYRRAGYPFKLHLAAGGTALVLAALAQIKTS